MALTVAIDTDVLAHYVTNSHVQLGTLKHKVKNINLFLEGNKQPTFNQVSDIAKAINIPTGLLLLSQPIELITDKTKFRTANSEPIMDMSDELRDTILEIESKQDFLRNEIEEVLTFVGQYSLETNKNEIISTVNSALGLKKADAKIKKSILQNPIKYFRNKINDMGVFVFFNGKVGDNTHRPLDTHEFRGFVLSDSKAPMIFINQTDSKNGQLFTLVHEFVHLFLDADEIFNVVETKDYHFDPLEALVNSVTAEVLVPKRELFQYKTIDIDELVKHFPVSKFTIARRLLDLNLIDKNFYNQKIDELNNSLQQNIKHAKKPGGDYNNNLTFRIDKMFAGYVNNAVQENRITTTDAINILGVGYKGYKTLQKSINQ